MSNTEPPEESQYVPYPLLLSSTFTPTAHANHLLHATTAPTDAPPLDLAPALSRALFDLQEVDTGIDSLTTSQADELVAYTSTRSEASSRVLSAVEEQVRTLQDSYERLRKEVEERWQDAEKVRILAERHSATLRLGKEVQRVVGLGRRLEGVMEGGVTGVKGGPSTVVAGGKGLVEAARTVLEVRRIFAKERGGGGGAAAAGGMLEKVRVAAAVKSDVVAPAERTLVSRAQTTVREFSLSGLLTPGSGGAAPGGGGGGGGGGEKTFAQAEEAKATVVAALQTLYLLSPVQIDSVTPERFEPTLLLQALQAYLQTALTSSLAALSRALATLPTLDRTLLEISARCQNIVALEALLEGIRPAVHPLLLPSPADNAEHSARKEEDNFLMPLLRHLDTSSLPSYFWRSLASQLGSRVQEILNRGGVSARTLRTNRDRVKDAFRECVDRGSRLPSVAGGRREANGNWEREAAVMVGSLLGALGR